MGESLGMTTNTPSAREQAQHFIGLLKKFQNAMLVTHTGEHGFHARPMAIADVEDDGRLWFITSAEAMARAISCLVPERQGTTRTLS